MKDYILYLHGANVRTPRYADRMDRAVRRSFDRRAVTASVYWGDVSDGAEAQMLAQWRSSPAWSRMWFPGMRSTMLLQLLGDSVIYVSRSFGAAVVERIAQTVRERFSDASDGDRLHLITHSWGAVIVLDLLFAPRWREANVPGGEQVAQLRDSLFGLGARPKSGVLLSSIVTMGSPMSLFSLMDADASSRPSSSHDISGNVREYSTALYRERGVPLRWVNLIHPGDAFAYPSAPLLRSFLRDAAPTIDAIDRLIRPNLLGRMFHAALGSSDLAISGAGNAHNSYWDSRGVGREVVDTLRAVAGKRRR